MVRWIPAILSFGMSVTLLYVAYKKNATDGPVFDVRHLFERRHTVLQSSRTQLVIEGIFGLLITFLYIIHTLSR